MLRLKRIWETDQTLKDHIEELSAKKVLLPYGHGLGDLIMFIEPYKKLREFFPEVEFTLALQKGLGFQTLDNDIVGNVLYTDNLAYDEDTDEYDIIADIDFPMNEGQTELTKGQYCCVHELGIPPNEVIYPKLKCSRNRLIAIQFHITCLPGACNPDRDVAEQIWNDVLEMGYIPIEMHFSHVFDNPENKKFDFIDSTVRRSQPQICSLVGLIEQCAGIISVVTGNLHIAIANKQPERIFFLEKDFKLGSFIKNDKIARVDVREYKGEVKEWLKTIDQLN